MFTGKEIETFGIEYARSPEMENAVRLWTAMQNGKPDWVDTDIKTVRFSNTIARQLAQLVTQQIDVKIEPAYGTDRTHSEVLQESLDRAFLHRSQEFVEKMIRTGGVMAKWNGSGMDYLPPDRFVITDADSDGTVKGAVFASTYIAGRRHITKLEYHRFNAEGSYLISNKAFESMDDKTIGREIPLSSTRWKDIRPETVINGLEKPLFVYMRNPMANTIDPDSPLGVPCFADCIEELRWLDIALSAMGTETESSAPIMFVDEASVQYATEHALKLPKFVRGMQMGINPENTVRDWQPTLQVESRKEGINFYLSIISYKCGFDPGYFVFNGQSISVATATQVEATERRTIDTVMAYRALFDRPTANNDGRTGYIHDIVYILDVMNTMLGTQEGYGNFGNYDVFTSFADLTQNEEENKQFDYMLANNGYMSKARFLVRHLGLTEEEALAMVAEANEEKASYDKKAVLFGEE